ncbi:MAG: alpha-1,2-fucosyltransferase [Candidatus Gastranaerophilales bacterium]|nr:alpha-1,2-fucosyltransferase [Candidatus Gastranaerophilales bacterium]
MKNTKNKKAIVRTDGGICSQIIFGVLGKYLEDLGYEVKYDITWFIENGKDCDGRFARDYSMEKAFPSMELKIATNEEIKKLKRNTCSFSPYEYLHNLPDRVYISGYPKERITKFFKYKDYFRANFDPVDKDFIQDIVSEVSNTNSCAVHVRRGDLANYNAFYGAAPSVEWFLEAMDIVAKNDDYTFYFFSDEPNWVKENIIPHTKYKCKIIDKNDSSKGYLDLYIMSKCKAFIASQGSLGIYARFLSEYDNALLIMPYWKDYVFQSFSNVIVLNEKPLPEDNEDKITEGLNKKIIKYKKSLSVFMVICGILLIALLFILLNKG